MPDEMSIGTLAERAGLTAETLRYYERRGLIEPSRRTAANYRLYDEMAASRLRFIRRAQALGFSLGEIAQLLSLHAYPESDMHEVKVLAQNKIREIDLKITDLQRMRHGLEVLTEQCPGRGSTADCPILGALLEEDG
ncbi:heavy metal-responsive transcriptional regulator [Acidihalobacter yilgarnensis]|uniref:Heavy metal-responsive transcriptional regulator n=1 Tax=Acidihalobacter yilgarnensis TaxID=2819280 RepID=A0A1D8IR09_9GAMM|nr:heavy metal-responsive transcriptional regulator [Acidihalobacter yilgarnensis]AOU98835.1 heavy metal-responsive transcriptional regulator [Acidihalobacter yilgarnensis]